MPCSPKFERLQVTREPYIAVPASQGGGSESGGDEHLDMLDQVSGAIVMQLQGKRQE